MTDDNPIILQTGTAASADTAVIWLHGLGADGNDFVPVASALQLPDTLNIRYIFPHAPLRPITINQGYRMRGWYDVTSLDIANQDDESGIIESSQMLLQLSEQQQAQGIAAERIVFAGFSQGGAIALYAGLRSTQRLGGIIALSTYMPMHSHLAQEAAAANRRTPIFMAHGLHDEVVALQFGTHSRSLLLQQGYPLEWHEYAMGHSVCTDEISHISAWLAAILDQG
ncbi:MAG: alpha/beta hydrolase fold domain-containing protein [Gammaproteobacteria bacterium]|nr:alpha/beta hydrolase fold domain-containing protein [Gammaproteobacteria bacterium]NNJ97694.1 alpha/beta hydrolase fold domain-containing protein [Gammaproteobacteria bacterium]